MGGHDRKPKSKKKKNHPQKLPIPLPADIPIIRRHAPERIHDARVHHAHAADRVLGEGHARADLAEPPGLLVDLDGDAAAEETEREDEADDAAAGDGDVGVLLLRGA